MSGFEWVITAIMAGCICKAIRDIAKAINRIADAVERDEWEVWK